jgi:photosystem II stability/assembly factor-like uncharacterized protein
MFLKSFPLCTLERSSLIVAAVATALLAAGCSPQPTTASATQPVPAPAADNPYGHVHGISVEAGSDRVLLATHNGLFDATADTPERIGPAIDLMGFSTAEKDHFYASGHPHPGTDMTDPVGLIHTRDGGETWETLSREGESDFHALTVTRDGVLGFDGQLRMTKDLENWTTAETGIQPYSLAGTPTSTVVLATTEEGVKRSSNGGKTWSPPANSPVLLITAFASDSTAVGVAPDGTVQISRDAGDTWEAAGTVSGQPEAVAAATGPDSTVRIWVATADGLEYSGDSGSTFRPFKG